MVDSVKMPKANFDQMYLRVVDNPTEQGQISRQLAGRMESAGFGPIRNVATPFNNSTTPKVNTAIRRGFQSIANFFKSLLNKVGVYYLHRTPVILREDFKKYSEHLNAENGKFDRMQEASEKKVNATVRKAVEKFKGLLHKTEDGTQTNPKIGVLADPTMGASADPEIGTQIDPKIKASADPQVGTQVEKNYIKNVAIGVSIGVAAAALSSYFSPTQNQTPQEGRKLFNGEFHQKGGTLVDTARFSNGLNPQYTPVVKALAPIVPSGTSLAKIPVDNPTSELSSLCELSANNIQKMFFA